MIGAGVGLPGPIDQRHRHRRLARRSCPAGSASPPRDELQRAARPPRRASTTTPTSARSPRPRSAPAAAPRDLVYLKVVLRHRRRPDPQRPPVPRRRRAAGELGHVLVDPDGPRLPLRQPRLPRDARRRRRRSSTLLRRAHGEDLTVAEMLALARDGDLGCRRVIADAGRAIGRARRRRCSTCSTRSASSSAASCAAAGDLLLDGVRESIDRARCPPRRGGRASSPACSATAPRCSARVALVVGEADSRSRPLRPRRRTSMSQRPHTEEEIACQQRCAWRIAAALAASRKRGRVAAACVSVATTTAAAVVAVVAVRQQLGGGEGAARSRCCCPTRSRRSAGRPYDRPLLKQAFEAAGVDVTIAERRRATSPTQQQQAEQAITNGAKVLLLVEPRLRLRRGDRGQRASRRASRSSTTTA